MGVIIGPVLFLSIKDLHLFLGGFITKRMTPAWKALKRAIDKMGDQTALARALKTTRQNVNQWRRVPQKWVPKVERITGIPRHELRPDLFTSTKGEG